MQARERTAGMAGAMQRTGALRVVALAAAICLGVYAPARATAGDAAAAVTATPNPTTASRAATMPAAPRAPVKSKSPYAAWRVQHEQADTPDTSGHGHRAPLPEGQMHPRRVPQ